MKIDNKKVSTKPASEKPSPLKEESKTRKREKIDKKKLIVYSEIMKPKFDL